MKQIEKQNANYNRTLEFVSENGKCKGSKAYKVQPTPPDPLLSPYFRLYLPALFIKC